MAASSHRHLASSLLGALALAALVAACSVGVGQGSIAGSVRIDECRLDNPDFELGPNFFAAEFVNDPMLIDPALRLRMVNIRIQHGSASEADSDGLMIAVRDVNDLQTNFLDVPIALDDSSTNPVQLTLYLGQQCRSGFPRSRWTRSAIMPAVSGTIRFSAIYAPGLPDQTGEISATFDNVLFEDAAEPTTRNALLSGAFSFVYQRGRPAQHFP